VCDGPNRWASVAVGEEGDGALGERTKGIDARLDYPVRAPREFQIGALKFQELRKVHGGYGGALFTYVERFLRQHWTVLLFSLLPMVELAWSWLRLTRSRGKRGRQ
jgi:hypothetical protein